LKSLLILGAKSEIAISTAKLYAKNGWDLILVGREVSKILLLFKIELEEEFNSKVKLCDLDILKFQSHITFFKSLLQKPDGVICFIGLLGNQKKSEIDFYQTNKIIDSNFTGIVSMLNIFANYFEKKGEGFIACVSSVAGDRGRKSNYTYGSAKAALTTYLSGLRNRLSSKNVHIMTVKPGYVKTKMTKDLNIPNILKVTPNYVAKRIYMMQQRGKDIIYIPRFWSLIMILVKLVPERIFKKLNI
tara:strand:- start:3237 stop:3971 length:735 start_codon:yes stop_codon:yes gene_type:complete